MLTIERTHVHLLLDSRKSQWQNQALAPPGALVSRPNNPLVSAPGGAATVSVRPRDVDGNDGGSPSIPQSSFQTGSEPSGCHGGLLASLGL